MTSTAKVLSLVVVNLLLALFMISPLVLAEDVLIPLIPVAIGNVSDIVLALFFFGLAILLLIHRTIWPLLNRTLFRMQDIGTKGRRGILMTVGVALLGWSGVKLPELARELLRAFG